MSDEIKVSRPQTAQTMSEVQGMGGSSAKGSKMAWLVIGVIAVLLIASAVLFRDKIFKRNPASMMKGGAAQSKSAYQAVFLTNGQVYFGKVTGMERDFMQVEDIYYLQVVQPPLQGQQQPGQEAAGAQPQISLVKLGQELHGPVDQMHINKSQILFYEDLKEDGQVVKAILTDKSKQTTPAK